MSSHGGMTALCELNYASRVIKVYPSFCSLEDNFDRGVGYAAALVNELGDNWFQVPMDPIDPIKHNILRGVKNDVVEYSSKEAEKKISLYLKKWAIRTFNDLNYGLVVGAMFNKNLTTRKACCKL